MDREALIGHFVCDEFQQGDDVIIKPLLPLRKTEVICSAFDRDSFPGGTKGDEGFRKDIRLEAQTSFDFLNIFVLANHHQEVRIFNYKIGTRNHLETVRKHFFYRNHLDVVLTSQMEFSNRLP